MTIINACSERDDLGGGRFRHVQHIKPFAYQDAGSWRRSVYDWVQGDVNWPHVISAAPMLVYLSNGKARICPTRDPLRYVEIGLPYIKVGNKWQQVNLGTPQRMGNGVRWQTAQADVWCTFGGHFLEVGKAEFKNGWIPPGNQIAFPVGMSGLTYDGMQFLQDGNVVLTMREPTMMDGANPEDDVRPVVTVLQRVSGQWYAILTLPNLTGMVRPVLDPTLTLQPDPTAGKDTCLVIWNATSNYGVTQSIYLRGPDGWQLYGLIQFDLSSIPANATVTSAVMSVYLFSGASTNNVTVNAHRAITVWYEGVKDGAVPDPGQDGSSWVYRNANGSVQWAGGNGGGSGSDYAAAVEASVVMGAYNTWHDFTITSLVQSWVNGTYTNNGIWLRPATIGIAKYLRSSDYGTADYRPKLVVNYSIAQARTFRMLMGVGI